MRKSSEALPRPGARGKAPVRLGSAVASEPVRVQMLGLWPAVLKPCGPACAQPFMQGPVARLSSEEMAETPGFVQENGERAHAFAERLIKDFGSRVRIEIVGLDSPRGIWLGMRHRVGRGFAVVVAGDSVIRDPQDYETLRNMVARAVRAP